MNAIKKTLLATLIGFAGTTTLVHPPGRLGGPPKTIGWDILPLLAPVRP